MADDLTEPTDFRHTNNASIYAPARDWTVACAATQAKHGVPLTEAQKVAVEEARKWKFHNPSQTMAQMHRWEK